MRRTCIAMPTYSGVLQTLTKQSLAALRPFAHEQKVEGISDVTLARSLLYTLVVDNDRCVAQANVDGDYDVVLCVDDDMAFSVETAQRLVNRARETQRAVSACYLTGSQHAAMCPWPKDLPFEPGPNGELVYLAGLGLCAIPTRILLAMKHKLPRVHAWGNQSIIPFCRSGADLERGLWHSEDMWFSRDVGGFLLEPIAAAHVKRFPLWPDERDIAALCAGEPLQIIEE